MARARVVVGDGGAQEIAELRRTVNNLLRILETMKASITATATAAQVLTQISEAISTGFDTNPSGTANIVSTGLELKGSVLDNRRSVQRINSSADVDLATYDK